MHTHTKTIETLALKVNVILRDINEGECGLPGKCMEKIAIERALRNIDPKGGDHKVRIDAGIIKFNLAGHRWTATTPKRPKRALLQFDKEEKARKRAEKLGEKFVSKVQPHTWTLEATKGSKILAFTAERQKQVNEARRRRAEEGRPDRTSYDLHKRVVGLASV
jgi:hypothetical protein